MHRNTTVLEQLATSVENARRFHADASDHAVRPWLMPVLTQLALSHRCIEEELCGRAWKAGCSRAAHDGRHGRNWRKAWWDWRIRNHFDSDLAYIQQAGRYELRLARRFDRALRRNPRGSDTHRRLAFGMREVDRARMELTHAMARVRDDINDRRIAAYNRARSA